MNKTKLYPLGLLFLTFLLISCTMEKEKEKIYDYNALSCYANGYECDVVFGSKVGSAIISTNTNSNWGRGGG